VQHGQEMPVKKCRMFRGSFADNLVAEDAAAGLAVGSGVWSVGDLLLLHAEPGEGGAFDRDAQAYMATERKLWGDASGKAGKGAKGGAGKGGAGKKGGEEAAALQAMQGSFGTFIAPHVPQPLPCCAGCACVFVVNSKRA
jgi:hypothetical protein